MSKVYCEGCLAEMPDYAHFCPLCGTQQADQAGSPSSCDRGGTLSLASQDFDTEFASASAGHILVAPSMVVVKKDDDILPLIRQARTMRHATHQRPRALRPGHQQSMRIAHKQTVSSPAASFATHTRAIRYYVIGTCIVLLVGLVVLLTSSFVRTNAQVAAPPSPVLITMNATSVFPGGSITLHGANFTPGATVTFSTDGTDLALAAVQPSAALAIQATLSSLAYSAASVRWQKAYLDASVQYDGTFDIALSVPRSWQANSIYKLQAEELSSGRRAFVAVKVLSQRYTNSNAVPKISLPT